MTLAGLLRCFPLAVTLCGCVQGDTEPAPGTRDDGASRVRSTVDRTASPPGDDAPPVTTDGAPAPPLALALERPVAAKQSHAACGVTAISTSARTPEDVPVTLYLRARSASPATLRFALEAPAHGDVAFTAASTCVTTVDRPTCRVAVSYAPRPDWNGSDRFTFTASDGAITSAQAVADLVISGVNDPPVLAPDVAATRVGTPLVLPVAAVLANDQPGPANEASQTLRVTAVEAAADSHGLAELADGAITYTPDVGFTGVATVRYTACDDGTTGHCVDPQCSTAVIAITVAFAGVPPQATPQAIRVAEDGSTPVTVAGTDADGDPLSFVVVDPPGHGTLSGAAPQLVYVPAPDYFGPDSFTFRASDGTHDSQPAKVAIDVTEVNDPPAAIADRFAVASGESSRIPIAAIVFNDLAGPPNEAAQHLTVGAASTTANGHGAVTLDAGAVVYTPDPGFAGTATITYEVCDDGTTAGEPDPRCAGDGLITLEVVAPDRPPIVDPQHLATAEDVALAITLTGRDPDGDSLTYEIVHAPEHGSLAGVAPDLRYTPAADYFGSDAFVVVASDGRAHSAPATIALQITEVNDPPVLGADAATLAGASALPPPPTPPPCGEPCGVVFGDPHLGTFDGGFYDFQAVGEFIAARSTTDDLELQVRTSPVPPDRTVSIATVVAMRVAGHRVTLTRTVVGMDARIDGVVTAVPATPMGLPGGGWISTYGSPDTIYVIAPDGSVAIVRAVGLFPAYYRFTVYFGLAASRRGRVAGVLGNADGDAGNDLTSRDGATVLPYPNPPFAREYPAYADSWRIQQAESLFDYGPGESTATFTDRTYPDAPATVDTLPAATRSAAAAVCALYGVVVPALLDACVVDVGVTGDAELASGAAEVQGGALGTPRNTGTTSIGTPTPVVIASPGDKAVRAFAGTAGQHLTLSVTQNTLDPVQLTILSPAGAAIATLSVTGPTAFRDVFSLPVTGTYTVAIDPAAQLVGALSFELDLAQQGAGTTAIGTPTPVVIAQIGETAARTFAGTAGQLLTLSVTDNTIASAVISVQAPSGSFVASLGVSEPAAFRDVFSLPETGTYTIIVDPAAELVGALTFELDLVPTNTGTAVIGAPTPVTLGTIGENAVRSFAGTAGQLVTVSVTDSTISSALITVRDPAGRSVASLGVSGPTAFRDVFSLPDTGTYTITVDPSGQVVGGLTFELDLVPANTGTTAIGAPTQVTIGNIGENAVRTFAGIAGQLVTVSVTDSTISSAVVTVRDPSGSSVASFGVNGPTAFRDVFSLPDTGLYTITIDPSGQLVGGLTFELAVVPVNTGTTAIGAVTQIAIGTAGENAVRSFAGAAGQLPTLTVANNTFAQVTLTIQSPSGAFVAALTVTEPNAVHDVFLLPETGTYTITIDPPAQNVGSLIFLVAELPTGNAARLASATSPPRLAAHAQAAATTPSILHLAAADALANDRPGPANEANQRLTITAVTAGPDSHGTASFDGTTITYTADLGFIGTATIGYTACDDGTTDGRPDPRCSDAAISIRVTANTPPVVDTQGVTTAEDEPLAITLTGSDVDGDPLTFVLEQAPAHGTLGGTAPNLVYTPAPDYSGPDSFRFTANDGRDASLPGAVFITVTPVNDPPAPQPDTITYAAGHPATVTAASLVVNDAPGPFDERDQTLTVTAVRATADSHGSVALSAGTITYTPDAGFTGTGVVTYTVCDSGRPAPQCADGALSWIANRSPTALPATAATAHDTAVAVTLAASDPEGDALGFQVVAPPQHGVVTGTGATVQYLPQAGFVGSDEFTFTASDAFSTSAVTTVTIAVTATAPPIVRPDVVATTADTPIVIDVLANDAAGAGALVASTLAVVGAPQHGVAVVEAGAVRYAPAAGVTPDDHFTYRVCDAFAVCGAAEVTIAAVVPNRAPVAVADSYQVDQGAALAIAAPGVVGNDGDPDPGDAIQARLDDGVQAGNLLLRSDGSFDYTPAVGFAGTDRFIYHLVDRAGLSSLPVVVTIEVVPPGPLAVDDAYVTTTDNPLTVLAAGVLANDRDAHSNDVLTAALSRAPLHGRVGLAADGAFVYTPDPGFAGSDSFLYSVTDVPGLVSAPARVTVRVDPPAGPAPVVGALVPASGARIAAPIDLTANIAPPAAGAIERWSVVLRNVDRGAPSVIASGTGAPPAKLATLDPTTLVNGGYEVLVRVEASGGGATTAVADVVVAGEMKLGDYTTTYLDLDTTIVGFPVQVLRTYDTTDPRLGDFGVGWRVELSSYRATPNDRLGQGGWSTEPFGFPFTRYEFTTSIPHFVTVTSPDGRVEVFDLVPAPSGPLLSLTSPSFVARPGTRTTSTLEDLDAPVLALNGSSIIEFLGGALYDPHRFRLTTRDGRVLIIDRDDGLQSIADRNGNQLIISADGVTSPGSDRQLSLARDGAGRITEVRAPGGKITRYAYSAAGDLAKFTGVEGTSDTFAYADHHRLLSVDGPGGVRLRTLTYGPDGRFTSITDAAGNTTRLASELAARREVVTSASGRLTTISTYDADGNLASTEQAFDAHARRTSFAYDGEGRPTRTTSPLGRVDEVAYDDRGNVVAWTTPKHERWTFAYDALNQLTITTDPDGAVYESNTYDERGNLVSTTNGDGTTVHTYDERGNLVTTLDPFGVTSYAYDADHQTIASTDALGRATSYSYDPAGNLATVTATDGGVTRYEWSPLGKLVQATDARGGVQAFSHDAFGRLTRQVDPLGRVRVYAYDDAGRLVSSADRTGQVTSYGYDRDGNLIRVAYADGDAIAIGTDPLGRRTSISDADTVIERTYDDDDNLVTERTTGNGGVALPDVTLAYVSDGNGQITDLTGPGGHVGYAYDRRARLASVTDRAGGGFAMRYDGADRLVELARPNHVIDALSYRAGSLESRIASAGSQVLGRAEYTLDPLRRRTSLTDLDGRHDFSHDAGDRLSAATHPAPSGLAAESFEYDRLGNRLAWRGSPASAVSYDAADQLLSDGTYDYSYDPEGRVVERHELTTGATTQYRWSAAGQLTAIDDPSGHTGYRYDALGRRVEIDDHGAVSRFVYSDWNVHLRYDGSNTLDAVYVTALEPGPALEVVTGAGALFPLADVEGSATALTDATGAVAGVTRFSAFGAPQVTGLGDPALSFGGHQFDATTGLLYARARYYDPAIGRFLSQDPEPSVNPYPYALDAPLEYIDPTGREATTEKIEVECRSTWNAAQLADARAKVSAYEEAARRGALFVNKRGRPPAAGTAQRAYRLAHNLGAGLDADHIIELVLGGAVDVLQGIDSSVNRSFGAQIGNRVRKIPNDTLIKVVPKNC